MSHPFDEEFEPLYQAFVARGGLDEIYVVSEDYERVRFPPRPAEKCIHGLTYLTCAMCYLERGRRDLAT